LGFGVVRQPDEDADRAAIGRRRSFGQNKIQKRASRGGDQGPPLHSRYLRFATSPTHCPKDIMDDIRDDTLTELAPRAE